MIYLIDNTIDGRGASPRELRAALEKIKPDHEIVVEHFPAVSIERVADLAPSHIILSGQSHPWDNYSVESLAGVFEVIRSGAQPTLGICGGHQQIALAFDAPVGLIKRIAPGEGYAGAFRERGFTEVEIGHPLPGNEQIRDQTDSAGPAAIFRGLPERIIVWESHCDEVKALPPGFVNTAYNSTCSIQAMQHVTLPVFGVQFHPELFDEERAHGRRLLENFLAL